MAAASERDEPGRSGRGRLRGRLRDRCERPGGARRLDPADEAGPAGRKRSADGKRSADPAAGRPEQPGRPERREQAERAGPAEREERPAAGPADRPRGRTFPWPHRRHRDDPGAAAAPEAVYGRNGERVPTGLGASLTTSGGMLLAMVEDVRMRGTVEPEELRPLADTFARHCAAKEVTVRKVLLRHDVAVGLVERDRQEGDLIQSILDRALMDRHPEDTRTLTVDGALTTMYQYLSHERRDLVPAIDRAVTREDSESLAAAFLAIAEL
ncbi:hypothetical protein [Actinacidiphila sp. ITFR-21]|uniref:hypothetical protein n=1 Tax=Actinacidiphila sp. ITFR-21 TaxID=3075199 RepID=UPI00288B30C1|nr:hypothetical protein [Streptomyces sp. ITFR-21]WNI14514.1 hypothetical protein RLT57_02475 [Streptomyces sp. ITFR-21]